MTDITLYGILDPNRSKGRSLADLAVSAAKGGVTILQYRDKDAGIREMIGQGRAIKQALDGSGVPLLINDRVDAALAIGADGVHVGQDDMPVSDARRLLGPDAIIGLSIKTMEHAENAPLGLLDYVCIGGVFDTMSKNNPTSIGVAGWKEIATYFRKSATRLPVGAIAGIDRSNVTGIIAAGADGVAIISGLFMADNVEEASHEMLVLIKRARGLS